MDLLTMPSRHRPEGDHHPSTSTAPGTISKWSQGELAERIGGDAAQISRYEHGKMTPGADIVARLAEALDVSCDYLLIDDAPRRSFRSPDRHLGEHLAALDELPEEDLASLLNHLDALIAKNRLKTIAGQLA